MALLEKAPAKINLSLDVLGKRNDGYHNVEMIMTTIDLADRIELSPLEQDKIIISLESRYVPNDERNLAYKAAEIFKEKYGIKMGVHIKIEKNIPVSAGLGGGSTDAAAVLRGMNRLWNLNIPLKELAELGATIGSDISFCVYGNTAIARGFGEKIEKLDSPPPCWVVLAKPDIGVSTRTIFARVKVDELYHPDTNNILEALTEKDFSKLCRNIGNSLEQITQYLHPEVRQIKEAMRQIGATGVLMSGSGPTVYGLVEHENKARRIYNGMRGFCEEVYLVRLIG
ncbi:4-(cytidine 5'-diphospho)-2-C-methyl-D-erythritol kinase [Oceanobacillus sp. 143]|jgi:4-diphosphocytidyl-2-C-methyl-D-erythritol kinase|uniref:4-diphosphocytidyl-2-C-methyl-D-erythritol kinase n=1 Tax=Oceanobacillus zhaokaii TaxID=2052660 RepID=A0A345PC09_9BACI|nr:4-(cytidine 5'-diphospho)-2-C-methyl-D-erythritol kinase [Oceanobacillus zhaokaii]AXI07539.1 4-(cytidine 5'-diphospho)-2-C-methyl-D-erythritol kinase [Oceanobacillus zhaokaii]QGS67767.1 4-(cytidine 5'-diphospho)-2-C-methyl-D-erythritol kinase [Oceanobacillus sp. 143]